MDMFAISRIPPLLFGQGVRRHLPALCRGFGRRLLLVTGRHSFTADGMGPELEQALSAAGCVHSRVVVASEPSAALVDETVATFRQQEIACVVAIGGGSVLDAGKAISAMLPLTDSVENYLEGIGDQEHPGVKVPFIALPTTAGTGSEATKNAVLSKIGPDGYKKSLRHANFIPDQVLIDPELAVPCPPRVTAASGMDGLTQLVEAFLSTKSNPMTDALALDGISKVLAALERAVHHGQDLEARAAMAYGAYLSGICLANAGLGVVHGFAQPLGCLFPIPHGVVCGTLMASVNRLSLEKSRAIPEYGWLVAKYDRLGQCLGVPGANAEAFVGFLETLTDKLALQRLGTYGVQQSDFPEIISRTSVKNHPLPLTAQELAQILLRRL